MGRMVVFTAIAMDGSANLSQISLIATVELDPWQQRTLVALLSPIAKLCCPEMRLC
jgi:hypothetical protein